MTRLTNSTFEIQKLIGQHMAIGDQDGLRRCLDQFSELLSDDLLQFCCFVAQFNPTEWRDEFTSDPHSELHQVTLGWQRYYQAQYDQSQDLFLEAFGQQGNWNSWAALGLGKVCSDNGDWNGARKWILDAMRNARRDNDLNQLAQCYGALGEVFFRTGHYKSAFTLFTRDKALLPPGHEQHARLRNYLAISLGRLGCDAMCQPMLWTSLYRSIDNNPISVGYSVASLLVYSFIQKDDRLFSRVNKFLDGNLDRVKLLGYSLLFSQAIRAFWAKRVNNNDQAVEHLDRFLASATADSYPVETAWLQSIRASWLGNTVDSNSFTELTNRPIPHPPNSLQHDVIDSGLLNIELPQSYHLFKHLRETTNVEHSDICRALNTFLI